MVGGGFSHRVNLFNRYSTIPFIYFFSPLRFFFLFFFQLLVCIFQSFFFFLACSVLTDGLRKIDSAISLE